MIERENGSKNTGFRASIDGYVAALTPRKRSSAANTNGIPPVPPLSIITDTPIPVKTVEPPASAPPNAVPPTTPKQPKIISFFSRLGSRGKSRSAKSTEIGDEKAPATTQRAEPRHTHSRGYSLPASESPTHATNPVQLKATASVPRLPVFAPQYDLVQAPLPRPPSSGGSIPPPPPPKSHNGTHKPKRTRPVSMFDTRSPMLAPPTPSTTYVDPFSRSVPSGSNPNRKSLTIPRRRSGVPGEYFHPPKPQRRSCSYMSTPRNYELAYGPPKHPPPSIPLPDLPPIPVPRHPPSPPFTASMALPPLLGPPPDKPLPEIPSLICALPTPPETVSQPSPRSEQDVKEWVRERRRRRRGSTASSNSPMSPGQSLSTRHSFCTTSASSIGGSVVLRSDS